MAARGRPLTAVPSSCLGHTVNYHVFNLFTRIATIKLLQADISWH